LQSVLNSRISVGKLGNIRTGNEEKKAIKLDRTNELLDTTRVACAEI